MHTLRYNIIAGTLCIVLCAASAAAQEQAVDKYVTAIEQRYAALQDFHADFEQETTMASVSQSEKGSGSVWLKKGGKMLWHYKKPEEQKIILDGKNLWIYLPADKQVMKNNFSAIPQHIVVDIFRGQINIRDKFTVALLREEPPCVVLELVPREYDPTVKKLRLWYDPEKRLLTKTELEDDLGTKTQLTFKRISIDKGIKDSLFEFTPPKGVDVFEPPQVQQ
ncbi:MAG: outer membrane lipoprotein chaperone LolA [Desulfobacterota bacterium]|nr:outer membrane lipoprotein chaperone LolA [Thermodesulfobacteriota bacterium]